MQSLLPLKLNLQVPTITNIASSEGSEAPKNPSSPSLDTKQLSKRHIDNPLIPFGLLLPEGVTIVPVIATPDHDRDIAIVNNFFSNQLWKPEYIGAYS